MIANLKEMHLIISFIIIYSLINSNSRNTNNMNLKHIQMWIWTISYLQCMTERGNIQQETLVATTVTRVNVNYVGTNIFLISYELNSKPSEVNINGNV